MRGDNGRYSRQIELFGAEGQRRLAAARVALVGLGGLGSHLAQQLAYLGVREYVLVDGDSADEPNLNRLVGAVADDIGMSKVEIAARTIRRIQPDADIRPIPRYLPHPHVDLAFDHLDLVLGGLDHDAARLHLIELASRKRIPYIDAATDTYDSSGTLGYGGRVVTAGTAPGCPFCYGLLDQNDIRRASMTPQQRAAEATVYGVPVEELQVTGPSVVTINGVVASLAATEAMAYLTGLREPVKLLTYYGDQGSVRPSVDSPPTCPYCVRWYGLAEEVDAQGIGPGVNYG